MPIADEGMLKIAEALDRLMTIDISARGSIGVLYEAARAKQQQPLTYAAVELLRSSIKPGDYVLIATGWADQYWNVPHYGETDGPPGAVALARSLRLALRALPVIVTDEYLADGMKKIIVGAGLHCVPADRLPASLDVSRGFAAVPTAAVTPFPLETDGCEREAARLIERYKPAVCISIERGGMNGHGKIHGMGGIDYSESQGRMDCLFIAANRRGIPTVGIGDGGNEIGMANIAETIRTKVPNGSKCKCPCGMGIAPSTPVNVLLTSTISNWAAYAVSCLLAAATGEPGAMASEEIEDRVLKACADADFHDTIGATVLPSVDGCRAPVHLAVIKLMTEIVLQGIKRYGLST